MSYHDPDSPDNAPGHRTGKPCIEEGCSRPAGTGWSPYWCVECNIKRMDRIEKSLEEIERRLGP